MPTKIAEKKLAISIICFVAAIFLFIKAPLITTPVHVSEIGILCCIAAVGLLILAMRFFKQAAVKV